MRPHEKERLQTIADEIVQTIIRKDEAYASSWKSHGGYSAFFNLDRKYSRVEAGAEQFQFDLFKATIELEEGRHTQKDHIPKPQHTHKKTKLSKLLVYLNSIMWMGIVSRGSLISIIMRSMPVVADDQYKSPAGYTTSEPSFHF